jgi:glycerol-3-phosphate acyltransferase PlsY
MIDMLIILAASIISYLIGAIPTGYIITKVTKGVDIRQSGSGNVGATNVFRVTGKIPGLITLALDILKGVLVIAVVANLAYSFTENLDYDFFRAFLGLVAICGHIWSVFLKFSGGKGVATTIGVIGALAPAVLAWSLLVWVVVFMATHYVSVGSLAFGIALPVSAALLNQPFYTVLLAVIICLINSYRHKANIKRLIRREESKTFLFKK